MVEFTLWDIFRTLLLAARWTVSLSLIAFIGHLLLFYGVWKFRPFNPFHQKTDWAGYIGLTLVLMLLTAAVCYAFDNAAEFAAPSH